MRPVQIALQLIEALSANQPAGVTELSQLTGFPRSTTQRALVALQKGGWIEVADERRGSWSLALRALVAAGRATESHGALRDVAVSVMEELRRSTGETIHLMVRQGNSVVLIERLDGIQQVDRFRPFGSDAPMTLTATGKALLAALDDDEVERIIHEPIASRRLHRVADPDSLREEIAVIRRRGYAMTLGENRANVGAVGAAIVGGEAPAFAAISASGPLSRMHAERCAEVGPLVTEAARRIGEASPF